MRLDRNFKAGQTPTILHQLSLALQDMDIHRSLVIDRSGEHFFDNSGDRRITLKNLAHDPAHSLNTKRQWHDIK